MRSLFARDVIVGQEKYSFAVDLQRLWIRKYRRVEWVKEEVNAPPLARTRSLALPAWLPSPHALRIFLLTFCVLILLGGSVRLFYTNSYLPAQQHIAATATAQVAETQAVYISAAATSIMSTATAALAEGQNPYAPFGGTLLVNAPLNKNTGYPAWTKEGMLTLASAPSQVEPTTWVSYRQGSSTTVPTTPTQSPILYFRPRCGFSRAIKPGLPFALAAVARCITC